METTHVTNSPDDPPHTDDTQRAWDDALTYVAEELDAHEGDTRLARWRPNPEGAQSP